MIKVNHTLGMDQVKGINMQNKLLIILLFITACKQPVTSTEKEKSRITSNVIDKSADSVISDFFREIQDKKVSQALEKLLSSNPYISLDDSATIDLRSKFVVINEGAGIYMGNRLLKKRVIGDDLSIYSYLVKYERKFYRFIFMFYNNEKHIRLYKFLFDDDMDIELENSLKFYIND